MKKPKTKNNNPISHAKKPKSIICVKDDHGIGLFIYRNTKKERISVALKDIKDRLNYYKNGCFEIFIRHVEGEECEEWKERCHR